MFNRQCHIFLLLLSILTRDLHTALSCREDLVNSVIKDKTGCLTQMQPCKTLSTCLLLKCLFIYVDIAGFASVFIGFSFSHVLFILFSPGFIHFPHLYTLISLISLLKNKKTISFFLIMLPFILALFIEILTLKPHRY